MFICVVIAITPTPESNINVINNVAKGRGLDTRNDNITLNVVNSTISTSGTNSQPITIGGSETDGVKLNISNSSTNSGDKGYAIIAFVPVDIKITDSTISGWTTLYMKDGSEGSNVEIIDSTLYSVNTLGGTSNDFAAISLEEGNININIRGSELTAIATNEAVHSLIFTEYPEDGSNSITISNSTITVDSKDHYLIDYSDENIEQNTILKFEGIVTSNHEIPEAYLPEYHTMKNENDKYVVYEKYNIRFAKIENGDADVNTEYAAYGDEVTLNLKPNEGYVLNKISVVANDNTVIEVKNNKFVMPDDEVAIIVTFSPIQKAETPVIGKDTEIGVEDAKETEEILLETISKNDDYKDKTVTVKVEVEDVKATTEVSKEFTEALKEAKLSDAKVLNFFDITIAVKNAITGAKLGVLPVLTKELTFAVEIPSDVEEVKEGYTRNYYIIRKHGEDIEIIKDVKVSKDGKYLTFDTNKFSTYALAYEDKAIENNVVDNNSNNVEVPKTGDSVALYVTLGFVSIAAIGISLNDLKKRTSR